MDEEKKPALSFLSIRNRRDTFEHEKKKGSELAEEIAYQETTPKIHQELPKSPVFPGNDPRVKTQVSRINRENNPPTNKTFPQQDEDEIDLLKYLGIVLIRKWWFIGTIIIVMIAGFILNRSKPIVYSSESKLAIKSNPIQETVGSLLLGKAANSKSAVAHHEERLRLPEENFLRTVQERIDSNVSIKEIEGSYTVSQVGESDLIVVSVVHRNPYIARSMADALASSYEDYDLLFRQRNYLEQESWIKQQIVQRKAILEALEIKIKEFHEQYPTFSEATQGEDITSIESELKNLDLTLEENSHRQVLVNLALKNADSIVVAEVTRDKPLQKELLNLEVELARLKVDQGEQSRKVQHTYEQMRNIKALIRQDAEDKSYTTILQSNPRYQELNAKKDDLSQELSVQNARKKELEKLLEKAYKQTSAKPELQLHYSRLIRDKSASEKIYTMLNEKLEETRLQKSGVTREAYQIGRATPAKKMDRGRISFAMNVLLALVVGFAVCFLIEQLDKTIRFPIEIEKNFGIPVLGIIPEQEADKGRLNLDSDSKMIEPYRSLRTNLNYSSILNKSKGKAIIITSALQGEGKSTKAVNLAICFSLDGQKILLVDADLRRPSIHGLLSQERGPGFSEFLTGQSEFSEVVQKTQYHNLNIVAAGNKLPNPAEILGSPRVSEFLENACAQYDVVFFDSPAIFPVSDALVLAPLMDGAVVIFRSNYTPIKAGEDVLRKLGQVGATVIGGVLNDVHTGRGGYYYSYYGYYGYSYYHNYYEEVHPNPKHPMLSLVQRDLSRKWDKWRGKEKKEFSTTENLSDETLADIGHSEVLKTTWHESLLKIFPLKWIYLLLILGVLVSLMTIFVLKQVAPPAYIPINEAGAKTKLLGNRVPKPIGKIQSISHQDTTMILKQLESWKLSQETGNLDLYFSLFSVIELEKDGKSFVEWKDRRQAYFVKVGLLQVGVGNIEWESTPDGHVWTRFPSNISSISGTKSVIRHILWGREQGKWRIFKDGVTQEETVSEGVVE